MSDQETQALIDRLKRIEGQARGIQKMIEEGRDCRQILTQLTAMRNATQEVGMQLVRAYAAQCLLEDGPTDINDLVTLISRAAS